MQIKEYSAGAVKFSFWFAEFRKMLSLLRGGKTVKEIKEIAANENIFSAVTSARGRQVFNTVSARARSLSNEYYNLFENSNLDTQKLIALVAVMETDALFFDFMNEVYHEKLITGDMTLTDADIRVFFTNKQRENAKVSVWTDGTFSRLRKCYKCYLTEAGLLERGTNERKIIKPLLDEKLIRLLTETGKEQTLHIFSGTRQRFYANNTGAA